MKKKGGITMISYKIDNTMKKAELGDVRLRGYVGKHTEHFINTRKLSDYGRDEVYPEAEGAFRSKIDDELGAFGIWQGEYWGKWAISAARSARYLGSEELTDLVRRGAETMMSYQDESGYLGTYRDRRNFFLPTQEYVEKLGLPARWNWNIWCRKYTLWGMLEAYELVGDKRMLDSARRMADALLDDLRETGAHICDTGTFVGLPSGSIMKPMLILYRHTEDKKYLDLALDIAKRWEKLDTPPALIANALTRKPISEWYPDSHLWAKAYEMMSCYDGIIELYRVTGERKYLDAAEAFYDIIIEHERNPLGSVAYNDMFGDAAYDANVISEPCDVIHFMRICHELFLLTGKKKYMDSFELSAYTPMLASAYKDGKWGARALRGRGRHLTALVQAKFTRNHCCVNNVPRGLLNIADSAIMTDGKALYINLYSELSGKIDIGGRSVRVDISGDYLGECRAKIAISFEGEPLKVKFRIPDWSKTVKFNTGSHVFDENGEYFDLSLDSSCEISAEFDDSIRVCYLEPHETRGNLEWKNFRWVAATHNPSGAPDTASADPETYLDGSACIIRRGPILLCRTKLIGNTEEEIMSEPTLDASDRCLSCDRVHTSDEVNIEFILTFESGKKYHVCDYASGVNMSFDDKRSFSIYF